MHFKKGFTLIELIVVVVIFSFLGVGIASCFMSGMKLWERIRYSSSYIYDYALGAERLNNDLLYFVPIAGIEFDGQQERLVFALCESNQIWEITYEFDPSTGKLIRKKRSRQQAVENQTSYMISDILSSDNVEFSYLCFDLGKKEYSWEDSWVENKTNSTLMGVKLLVKNQEGQFNKTTMVYFP